MKKELKQLKQKELKPLREKLFNINNGFCPIIKQQFDINQFVIDHQHKTLKEEIGINGAGLIRGCIHRQANSFEGKVTNSFKRYGLDKFDISLPDLLRNLADYLEQSPLNYIHPNEQPKNPYLMKKSYNKLKKCHNSNPKIKKHLPDFPEKGKKKMTKYLQKLYDKYNIIPEFYK
jgi:hypothetical protein